ncbi:SIR2 family protein [uncultured Sulfitobacter sp.]|uniref:SIR2 family protein n=1 Tax=uncultured Sulfitobacter sp. TaxID=191468 RepID=UPI0026253A64|nr:SIR2 family protein [uncultured Sulfitobacter sp.]
MTKKTSDSANADQHFSKVREQLRNWPYTIHQIDDTLDISLIEGRGKQLLFRAIQARNLSAFAGTGLSIGYGRLGWTEWEQEQQKIARANARAFIDLVDVALKRIGRLQEIVRPIEDLDLHGETPQYTDLRNDLHPDENGKEPEPFDVGTQAGKKEKWGQPHRHNVWRWLRSRRAALQYARRQITGLNQTFVQTQEIDGSFPGGEEMPVKFEVAQQLHQELQRHVALFLPPRKQKDEIGKIEEKAWFGARQTSENAAPEEALEALRGYLKDEDQDEKYTTAITNFADRMARPEARFNFDTLAKVLLVDECPHALLLLRKGIFGGRDPDDKEASKDTDLTDRWNAWRAVEEDEKNPLDVFNRSNLKRDIDGIRENKKRYRVLSPFKIDAFRQLLVKLRPSLREGEQPEETDPWVSIDRFMYDHLTGYVEETPGRTYLSPAMRFVVTVLLSRLDNPSQWLAENGHLDPPHPSDFSNRTSIIDPRFDPMQRTVGQLGIRRYVTTNYDFEIERFFMDAGYRHFKTSDAAANGRDIDGRRDDFRTDDIGGILRDQTFEQDTAADMVTFAIGDDNQDAAVYHLHGRASKNGKLVITERDYMELYLSSGPNRATADEGISLIFSGAPLIFLGLGMKETDLLRPLRQFISNRDRTIGYTSIALLPADGGIAARTKFASGLYLRYGVHTIFYGSGQVTLRDPDAAETQGLPRGIDWLHRVLKLTSVLKEITEAYLSDEDKLDDGLREKKLWDRREIIDHIETKLGTIEDDLAVDGYPAATPALWVLLGLHYPVASTEPTSKEEIEKLLARRKAALESCIDSLGKNAGIQHCEFTPTRPRPDGNPHSDTDTPVSSKDFLEVEIRTLTELLKMTLKLPETRKGFRDKGLKPWQNRDLRSRILFLDGLNGAIRTGAMNAGIEAIVREQRQWWSRFQQSPPHRLARFQMDLIGDTHPTRRYIRHRVDSVITDLDRLNTVPATFDAKPIRQAKEPKRIDREIRTRIRAFDTFIVAADTRFETVELDTSRRLLITVAAHRGIGKGTFLSAFSSARGLALYQRAVWRNRDRVKFAGAIHINLSFSAEVASVLDMLIEAIQKETIHQQRGPSSTEEDQDFRDALKEVKETDNSVSRMTRLKLALNRFRDATRPASRSRWLWQHPHPRLLITLNATELLFDSRRHAKNMELEHFIAILTGPDHADCPVDIVFVGSERGLGHPWTCPRDEARATGQPLHVQLNRPDLPADARELIDRRRDQSGITIDDDPPKPSDRSRPSHFIHFARPVSPTAFLVDNFPTLATALFLAEPPVVKPQPEGVENTIKKARQMFNTVVKEAVVVSDDRLKSLWASSEVPTRDDLHCARNTVRHAVCLKEENEPNTPSFTKPSERLRNAAADLDKHIVEISDICNLELNSSGKIKKLRHALSARVRSEPHREQWKNVRRRLGDSRFAMTILIALAEHKVVHARDPAQAGTDAGQFILSTVEQGRNFGRVRHDEFLLETVLSGYRTYHKVGDPDNDCDLHQLILRHLGAVGTPLGSAVLVRLPEIRDYFARINIELPYSRRRFLVRALTTLAYRGLVFRLDPHPRLKTLQKEEEAKKEARIEALRAEARDLSSRGSEDAAKEKETKANGIENSKAPWPADREHRYALHRLVQRFAVNKLNIGAENPLRANSFSPTLHAAMPSAGPSLSSEPYSFLRNLLLGLSQYPDISNRDQSTTPWLFTTEEKEVRVQALRAALCLARTNLSVAIVSRLSENEFASVGLQKRGYLETYKVRLRWIIRLAWELMDSDQLGRRYQPDAEFKQVNSLYRDEIVWIYNELGVVSLAQGALSDALGFLRQAAEFNEHIEGRAPGGPNYKHISLNHAVVQLERGRLQSARTRLDDIVKGTQERKCVLHQTAQGYLCVLDHITGRHEDLQKRFETVTHALQELPAPRASAIILSHRARFLMLRDSDGAREAINRAAVLAETGGHEDIRHHCNLIETRITHSRADHGERIIQDRSLSVLRDVDSYAERMSIWSLQCEGLMHRAALLLEEGETTTAGRLLMRAIAIARRHSMGLRLNRAMTLYAMTLLRRGDRRGAARLATASLDRAKAYGYNLETSRAQQILTESESENATLSNLAEPRNILF